MEAAEFVQRWSTSGGSERANYALFLTELCDVLDIVSVKLSPPRAAGCLPGLLLSMNGSRLTTSSPSVS
ncbi:hypothetical protein [Botrimarina mediterranea]|uniref:hypothetical protein n=1 Tax=Botrimarina mediterranea TaxID=2528022 RepID=UPI00118CC60C|nr:hypothetical protein K2D_06440 [Planctomycetes bacterium K2D]